MSWYTDPGFLSLLVFCAIFGVLAVFACIRSSQLSQSEHRPSPASFEVQGADGQVHTMMRRPVGPPPDPDSAPGEVSFPSPGTTSRQALRDSARALRRTPR